MLPLQIHRAPFSLVLVGHFKGFISAWISTSRSLYCASVAQRINKPQLDMFPAIFHIYGLFSRVSSRDHHWEDEFKQLIDS